MTILKFWNVCVRACLDTMLRSFELGRVQWRFRVVVQFADTFSCKIKSSHNDYVMSWARGPTLSSRRVLPRHSKFSSHLLLFPSQKHRMNSVPCNYSCCHSWAKRKRFLFRTFILYSLFLFFLVCKHSVLNNVHPVHSIQWELNYQVTVISRMMTNRRHCEWSVMY